MVYGKEELQKQTRGVILAMGGMQATRYKLFTIAQEAEFDIEYFNSYDFIEFVKMIEFVIGKRASDNLYMGELQYMVILMIEWFEQNREELG